MVFNQESCGLFLLLGSLFGIIHSLVANREDEKMSGTSKTGSKSSCSLFDDVMLVGKFCDICRHNVGATFDSVQ